jgi:acetaldehyde dehydrogenase (acetylating)
MAFGLEKPVHRIVVNTMCSLGATGLTTGMAPSMTLGPGGVGGAITGDNIGVRHLFSVKTIAWELRPAPPAAMAGGTGAPDQPRAQSDLVEQIVQRVLADLRP